MFYQMQGNYTITEKKIIRLFENKSIRPSMNAYNAKSEAKKI